MKTIVSIFLPWISNELIAQKIKEEPKKILLYSNYRGQKIIVRGLKLGCKLTEAHAHLSKCTSLEYRSHEEEMILQKLVRSLEFISPLIERDKVTLTNPCIDCPNIRHVGVNIDITSSIKLFKGVDRIVSKISKKLNGFSHKIAVTESLGSAWAISRYSKNKVTITSQRDIKHHISNLPIASLRIDGQILKTLTELNLCSIGELLKLPRTSLLKRFGPDLSDKIDYLLGIKEEPINALHFEPPNRKSFLFSSPVYSKEPITYRFELLLLKILESKKDRLISTLTIELIRVELSPFVRSISLSRPSANFDFIWSLLQQELEMIEIGDGVDEISLYVTESTYPKYVQTNSLSKSTNYSEHEHQLLDQVAKKIGKDNILYHSPQESHLPENTFLFSTSKPTQKAPETKAERPTKIFCPPQKIRAMGVVPDKPPFWIRWNNDKFNVHRGTGPERIENEWWTNSKEEKREYFSIQIESGLWLWVYREIVTNTWYIHGVWT